MTDISIRIHAFVTSAVSSVVSKLHREEGQDLIEYALLGGLIALGIMALGLAVYSGIITVMTDGIKNCVDFDDSAGSVCNPF